MNSCLPWGQELLLRWEEAGGRPVRPPTRTDLSGLIEQALAQEIDGTTAIDYRPGSVLFTTQATLPAIRGDMPPPGMHADR